MTTEEMQAAIERLTAERDAAAESAKAFAAKLANEYGKQRKLPRNERVHVLVVAQSELDALWFSTDNIEEIAYRDNGSMPRNPKYRWELVLWDYNGDDHVLASGPTREGLQAIEPHIRQTWHKAMQVLWHRLSRDLWSD